MSSFSGAGHYFAEQFSPVIKRFFPEIDEPEMEERVGFYSQVFRDLINYGLIATASALMEPPARVTDDLINNIRTVSITDMGKRFIKFITSPISNDEEGE